MEFLDDKRLGKQRVEAGQILEILLDKPILPSNLNSVVPFERSFSPWSHHPAILMWREHEEWLKLYLACAIGEWSSRGFINNIVIPVYNAKLQKPPPWLGYEPFHKSHRCNLIRKLPDRYLKFWPEDRDDDCSYYWPSHNGFSTKEKVNGINSDQTAVNP